MSLTINYNLKLFLKKVCGIVFVETTFEKMAKIPSLHLKVDT